MTAAAQAKWSHSSVTKFARDRDPIKAIEERARSVVLNAIDQGWSGPPFDPIRLADILGLRVRPSADIKDARTVPIGRTGAVIEFNPNRPRGRVRFSIAHEIAHTFFEDYSDAIRYRGHVDIHRHDSWQLEMLCNIAAAELIMPFGDLSGISTEQISISRVMELRAKYDVSTEAVIIRIVKLTQQPLAAFSSSCRTNYNQTQLYRLDYVIPSPSWTLDFSRLDHLPEDSVVSDCSGVGFTAAGNEKWSPNLPSVHVECVGLAPYPGASRPRVAGFLKYERSKKLKGWEIAFNRGDAHSPVGKGIKIIAHIVNDKTLNWGGGGFAAATRRKLPSVQQEFKQWARMKPDEFKLGFIHVTKVTDTIFVASMIAQKGYGPSSTPRFILAHCLNYCADS